LIKTRWKIAESVDLSSSRSISRWNVVEIEYQKERHKRCDS
jgi:hypothetical protein